MKKGFTLASQEGKLKSDQELGRLMLYVNPNPSDISQMEEAYKINDYDSMREVFSRFDSGFVGNIFAVYDVEFKDRLVRKFLDVYSKDDVITKDIKPRTAVPKPPKTKPIKQKSKSGTTYSRSKPLRFTSPEVKFFKDNKGLKGKDVYAKYIKIFPHKDRTKSSVLSKFYRERK